MYPLEKAFIYVIKPKPIYIRFDEIHSVYFQKGGEKSFELAINLKKGAKGQDTSNASGKSIDFISLEREEYPRLFKFCQEKKIRIANLGKKEQNTETVPLLEGEDAKRGLRTILEGDWNNSGESSEDDDFDIDEEYQRENKRVEKDQLFEEDSGSGGSSEFEGSSEEDYDGDDVIDFDEDDEKPAKKSSSSKRSKKNSSPKTANKKAAKDPNAPKKPQTAFFLWLSENRESIKEANPEATLGQISKIGGEKWRELSDDDKQPYEEKYKSAKEDYDEAMKSYKPSGEFAKSSKKSSKSGKKDANAPKKPQSAYFLWMNDNRARIKGCLADFQL